MEEVLDCYCNTSTFQPNLMIIKRGVNIDLWKKDRREGEGEFVTEWFQRSREERWERRSHSRLNSCHVKTEITTILVDPVIGEESVKTKPFRKVMFHDFIE